MRLAINPRAVPLLGRLPRPTVYSALELLLLALIAVQAARLFWILVTPVDPVGDYKGSAALSPAAGSALADFDPFFRLTAGGPAVVTSLNLQLHGVREDRATGRGSAIIALPDGSQQSFAVGDEIMPGVTLAEVAFDSVTISRGGAREQIFLDQSEPAAAAAAPDDEAAPAPAPVPAAPMQAAPAPRPAAPAAPAAEIQLQPRASGGRVQGVAVSGDPQALRAAGLVPGDVILAVGGQRVTSTEQAWALLRRSGGQATLLVNRGGRAVPIVARIDP